MSNSAVMHASLPLVAAVGVMVEHLHPVQGMGDGGVLRRTCELDSNHVACLDGMMTQSQWVTMHLDGVQGDVTRLASLYDALDASLTSHLGGTCDLHDGRLADALDQLVERFDSGARKNLAWLEASLRGLNPETLEPDPNRRTSLSLSSRP